MKFDYSPGLLGYGLKGSDGSLGLSGAAVYFTDYYIDDDRIIIQNAIKNNYVLFSTADPNTPLPGGRQYNVGDLIIEKYGGIYQIISTDTGVYNYRSRMNTTNCVEPNGEFTSDDNPYMRYNNIFDSSSLKILIDNVYTSPANINYFLFPQKIYGILTKEFARIEYTNVVSSNANAFTLYSSVEDLGNDQKALALVRDICTNTFRLTGFYNISHEDNLNLTLDFVKLKINTDPILKDTRVGEVLSSKDISLNSLVKPLFDNDPVNFTMITTDPCTIQVSWELPYIITDPCISGDLYFYESSTGATRTEFLFSDVDSSGSIIIEGLIRNATYASYLKLFSNGWYRTSVTKTLVCGTADKIMTIINPASLIINASANGTVDGSAHFGLDFSTNSTNWTIAKSDNWITITPSSSTGININEIQHVDVSLSYNTASYIRDGYLTISSQAATKNIDISQLGTVSSNYLYFSPSRSNWDQDGFPCSDSTLFTWITSNVSWTTSKVNTGDGTSWFAIDYPSGTGNHKTTVTVNPNVKGGARSGIIRATGGGITADYTISQVGWDEACVVPE